MATISDLGLRPHAMWDALMSQRIRHLACPKPSNWLICNTLLVFYGAILPKIFASNLIFQNACQKVQLHPRSVCTKSSEASRPSTWPPSTLCCCWAPLSVVGSCWIDWACCQCARQLSSKDPLPSRGSCCPSRVQWPTRRLYRHRDLWLRCPWSRTVDRQRPCVSKSQQPQLKQTTTPYRL